MYLFGATSINDTSETGRYTWFEGNKKRKFGEPTKRQNDLHELALCRDSADVYVTECQSIDGKSNANLSRNVNVYYVINMYILLSS